MSQSYLESAEAVPEVRLLTPEDLRLVLFAGLRDFRRAPAFGLFFAATYVIFGWIILYALTTSGNLWWILPAAAGFPILGPFLACGLYEVSRRLELGLPLHWGEVLGVILSQKDRQIPSMAAVVVIFFLFWNFLSHMVFALFMGMQPIVNISSSFESFLTAHGLTLLVVELLVGAVFASILFSITVISLPLLLDREIDFVTAMITSVQVVQANPVLMLSWGITIAGILFFAMLPGFLGLLIALPVLGHATWHLYRLALD
ncbi:DUF2189 domain-containing protein [Cereibacter johrii]|uniref:Membrane protein n=1 Tax=Cereibacter johrii TaxID=445629 RepID=A0ABX5JDX5_9RHOB|nr:DUF2189 domain-containing protein [Cereibacter johrii]QCP85393.1 DUF2189 domain-containing protein [Cereibacter sphaeroides]RDS94271.1 DUF2189 domain-containing protein [Cereibacter sphaeroides f. sp. denitrificans]MEA5160775.1 DUF2189 domain-containing protein [Cereibacter johrii]ODM42520.1 hypothetical protein A9O63_12420 [Cereibacter johrii]PTM80232.1 putative membrane protein [Cereibacter johrii]